VNDCERQLAVASFLYDEAALLDAQRHREWLDLLSQRLVYEAPVSVSLARGERRAPAAGHYFRETRDSLAVRVDRLYSGHAHADDPPWLTRRMVSNVQVLAVRETGEVDLRSNLLLLRSRGDSASLLGAERLDTLADEGGRWRLLRRTILLAHTVLPGPDLPVFM